ncbi:MAG: response regulator [Armatimonadetes bacterium]|nr:response regulator [Armatimonadota bacterium]
MRHPIPGLWSSGSEGGVNDRLCSPEDSEQQPAILLLDDDRNLLTALEGLLEGDYRVISVTSGVRALDVLQVEPVAVIVSDQIMPGMSGDELLARAAAICDANGILLTGCEDLDAVARAINQGRIFGFLRKPFAPEQLLMLIRRAAEHYRLTRELKVERELLRCLMDSTPDLIAFRDQHGRFFRLNRSMATALGLTAPEKALGKTLPELGFRESGADPAVDRTERLLAPEGARWYSTTRAGFALMDGSHGSVSISRDITERQQFQKELLCHASELKLLNQDLRQFAFATAHHLQEPLRQVASCLELIARRSPLQDDDRQLFDFAVAGARRMKALLRGAQAYTALEIRERTWVDCDALLKSLAEQLRPRDAQAVIRGVELPTVYADRDLLELLFRHLVENSLAYRAESPPRVLVKAGLQDGSWLFSVSDNGIGIPEEYQDRVFEMFQRLGPGSWDVRTGLGLAVCRKIVGFHGGQIWCRSCYPNPGTSIHFTLRVPSSLPEALQEPVECRPDLAAGAS